MTPPSEPDLTAGSDLRAGPDLPVEPDLTVGPDLPVGWTAYLDPTRPRLDEDPASPAHLGRWTGVGLLIALVAAAAVIWGPAVDTGEDPPPVAAVLGRHLAVPIALRLPVGAIATADGSYIGVQFSSGGVVLVTVPTQVVDPSGARTSLPADPAGWLARHPAVFVSRVRATTVGGTAATQVDYRRARTGQPQSRFARLPLFCGWRTETDPVATDPVPAGPDSARTTSQVCTQITADARVRATFVHLGGRTVLVEAVWPVGDGEVGSGRMPPHLRRSYTSLLAGLSPAAATS